MTKKCAAVLRTAKSPYYTRCVIELPDHGVVHEDDQEMIWVGEWESEYATTKPCRLPFYFSVKVVDCEVTWKCIEVASGKPIAKSPCKYATIDEAHKAIKAFQEVMRR